MSIVFIQVKKTICWLSIVNIFCIFGCAAVKIKDGAFSPQDKNYIIKIPGTEKGWEPMQADKEDIALWHKQYKAMIAIISSNIENKGFSLEMLNRHLFWESQARKLYRRTLCLWIINRHSI